MCAFELSTLELHAAVFSDTAKIVDEGAQVLRLGLLGPAGPVTFRVETPIRRRRTRLRVLLYYRHHVPHAFTLSLALRVEEMPQADALVVSLAYSRREQLRDLDDIPERVLSVAANENTGGGSHLFMFDSGHVVQFSESDVSQAAQAFFRQTLAEAVNRLDRAGKLRSGVLAGTIKQLAFKGSEIWEHLYSNAAYGLQVELDRVAETEGRIIQLLRLKPQFAFPWAMVYDRPLPETLDERERAPLALVSRACARAPRRARHRFACADSGVCAM